MADNEIRNEISQLGKYKLIHHLTEEVKSANESTVAGIGDDAAATRSGGLLTVTANKLFVEHIHFDPSSIWGSSASPSPSPTFLR